MWTSLVKSAFGLTMAAQMATSRTIVSRQEQCESATSDAAQAACAMKAAFGGSSIIPQLFPDFSPKAALSVKYGDVTIGGAQQMSPAKVAAQPFLSLSFISSDAQSFKKAYVVVGLEYRQKSKTMELMWLQSAVKIDGNTGLMSSSTPPIVKYKSPNPNPGSGTNEYILFVFQDPGLDNLLKQNPQVASALSGAFDFQGFMAKTKLTNQVVAGSYFKSSVDGSFINSPAPSASTPSQAQVPQTPPVSSRVANDSSVPTTPPKSQYQAQSQPDSPTAPIAPVQSMSEAAPIAPVQSTGEAAPITPVQSISEPDTPSAPSNQTEPEQKVTSNSIITLEAQKYMLSLIAVVVFGVSQL
ncbi:hypothetical protein PGT21_017454 [Puccinia graminis f. sp. tritici]|uniref:Uncharacterized protein n=1 Tax=Puccinia graminis f. sp. tritici TaxID=56615 RepID=A0A5B0RYF2_PUCGR|nr:hypothetical protein PGT21_017454 [Puccinia graminis f. sp. tritici]KAA1130482.1 hypothetical protein PGTUg99_005995 [Puccinia graminis f. sp. tritici]